MTRIVVPDIGDVEFNSADVPISYEWSGYTHSREEFEQKNFLVTIVGGQKILICSEENATALCDYLANEIIDDEFIHDMENICSLGYDFWFYLRHELSLLHLEEFPLWIQDVVGTLLREQVIYKYSYEDAKYFFIVDPDFYINNSLPESMINQMKKYCESYAFEYWRELLEQEGEISEIPKPECGEWGLELFERFCHLNEA